MANYVFIAASLDGFIARKDGSIDWLSEIPNPDNSDYGYNDFIKNIDAILMGRATFEKVLTFGSWPYDKSVFVISSSLKSVDMKLKDKVEIVNGSLKSILESINSRNLINLYIDGGKTIQSFLKEDLIDEMIITKIPVLLGNGIPLFSDTGIELKFEHVNTNIFSGGLIQSHYKRIRS
jgi:dihydrofolate reductase